MKTDQPERTESPGTLDAGRFKMEVDVPRCVGDRHNSDFKAARVETAGIAPINREAGLCDSLAFPIRLQPLTCVRAQDGCIGMVRNQCGVGGSDWIGTVDAGLTCALTDDFQLDARGKFGVTRAASGTNPFFGIT
jgi:hypothetical protein